MVVVRAFVCRLLVAVALLGPGASGRLWLCVLSFVLLFLFLGDLMAAGVTFQLPHGRDVGSQAQGHRPKNWCFLVVRSRFSSPTFSASL